MSVRLVLAATVWLASSLLPAQARDLGQIGPTYAIGEPHFIETLKAKLKAYEDSPAFEQMKADSQERARQSVMNPPAVPGIVKAQSARTFFYDPTYTLDRNVFDAGGRLLFAAGTKANPLNVVSMPEHLLFFDARDERQVKRARELIDHYQGRVMPILVGGSYMDLMKRWQLRVYYDQHGVLTRQLGIRGVPAIVSQEGLRLRIDELVVQ